MAIPRLQCCAIIPDAANTKEEALAKRKNIKILIRCMEGYLYPDDGHDEKLQYKS